MGMTSGPLRSDIRRGVDKLAPLIKIVCDDCDIMAGQLRRHEEAKLAVESMLRGEHGVDWLDNWWSEFWQGE